jgi:hypothetical protein
VSFDTQPVRVNGRPVTLEEGESGDYFIPLAADFSERPFVLEIRYAVEQQGRAVSPPEFPMEPAVQQVFMSVFFPREWSYLGFAGPWHDEIVWVLDGFRSWPRARRSSDWLINWVCAGTGTDASAVSGFATDGRHVLYSTIRPESGEDGRLVIRAMRERVLMTILLLAVLGAGLGLVAVGAGVRLLVIGAALVVVVLLGVFSPSLARAVVNNGTAGAGAIVLVVWFLWYLLVTRPRDPDVQARREARRARRAERRGRRMKPVASPEAGGDSDTSDSEEGDDENAS